MASAKDTVANGRGDDVGLTIGQLAERTGLSGSAIRYYERVGLLPEADRVGGWRRYDGDAVRLVNAIRFAKRAGFSLDEIRTLFHGFPPNTSPSKRWQELASRKLAEVDELIARAETMRSLLREGLDCDCVLRDCRGLEDCELDPGEPRPVTG
jgi:MerR family redox-sensitive transcriptional activator SoxR